MGDWITNGMGMFDDTKLHAIIKPRLSKDTSTNLNHDQILLAPRRRGTRYNFTNENQYELVITRTTDSTCTTRTNAKQGEREDSEFDDEDYQIAIPSDFSLCEESDLVLHRLYSLDMMNVEMLIVSGSDHSDDNQ